MPVQLKLSIKGKQVEASAVGVRGVDLFVTYMPEVGPAWQGVAQAWQAADEREFWAAWRSLGGGQLGLHWPDGEPFSPS